MKLAFSNTAYPDWDLKTLLQRAKQYGYDGVELCGLGGGSDLPAARELADATAARQSAAEAGVEIVGLGADLAFHAPSAREAAEQQMRARRYIDLAARLGCPMVRVRAGELPSCCCLGREHRNTVLARVAQALRVLAAVATERGVTLVVENGGDFPESTALWYIVDAAGSPAVRCCWNPLTARLAGELPTRSIPRLAARLGLVRVGDAKFDAAGGKATCVLPGQGDADVRQVVQLLKGVGYRGYLVLDWPAGKVAGGAEEALPAAAAYLRQLLSETPVPLTAYKGDKNKPRQGYELATS